MSKVYLLLRNNKQSGPHSLEELLTLDLKPLDLIWIEGKSFGWSYPAEISLLKPYVEEAQQSPDQVPTEKKSVDHALITNRDAAYMPAATKAPVVNEPAPSPRKVHVSLPANMSKPVGKKKVIAATVPEPTDKIEQKAEELRKKIQTFVPEKKTTSPTKEEPLVTKYSSSLPEREEEYTSWIYNKKVGKTTNISEDQKKWAAIAMAAVLILAIGFGISHFKSDPEKEVAAVAVQTPVNEVMSEPLITEVETPADQIQPANNDNTPKNESVESSNAVDIIIANSVPAKAAATFTKIALPASKSTGKIQKPVSPTADVQKKSIVSKAPAKDITVKAETPKLPEVKTDKNKANEIAAEPKKKKSLNEKVDAFFNKFSKKLDDKPVKETSTSTPNSLPGQGERKAVHRDDQTAPPVVQKADITLADFVEITSTKPSENWMLGVRGMKVSVRNTSSELVKTAEVELRYYTEQNEVLEKKIVNFSNIPPGKTVTLPAPDHRLADHADFRLVNAR